MATIQFSENCDKIRVVPNGVDSDSYSFEFAGKSPQPLLVFLANFNYFPNTDAINFFVKQIFPKILSKIPNVRLRILGYHADTKLAHLRDTANIEICGYKPDVRADIAEGWIFVCPLRLGSGSRIKILESMALGTPVVSTSIGCAGLPVENGRNIVVAENSTMAESIIKLISKPHYRKALALNARELVESQMTWERSVECLENIYSEIVHSQATRYS
jgi:glycosyltransferase involved in cell wall biosynthesis